MTIQRKVLLFYFSAAFALILGHHYGATAQNIVSDQKIKLHVSTLDNNLETLMQLQPKRFEYNRFAFDFLNLPKGKHYGFITEDFQKVLPHLVRYQTYSYRTGKNQEQAALIPTVDLEKLVPLLVGAMQEQQALIEQLQQEVTELKKQRQQL